jgi:DNA-binding MarR family transcriptional regulator
MDESVNLAQLSILWMHLDEAAFLISTAREKELKKVELSSLQMKALLVLNYVGEAMTIHELCHWLVRGHTSISLITDKMVNKGLVDKYPDASNKNQTLVRITRKGKNVLSHLLPSKPIPNVLSVLSAEERDQLITYLKKIIAQAVTVTSPPNPPNLDELSRMLVTGTKQE